MSATTYRGRDITLEQAKLAVKAARDFGPAGEHYSASEVGQLNRLCRDAFLACRDANTSIGAMRLELYRLEREEHRQKLEAICNEFKAAALAQTGRRAA
jgi:uncharacterized protein YcbK (DUF882 family)